MKEYIVIAWDGIEYDCRGKATLHTQCLGIYQASSVQHAAELCRERLICLRQSYEDLAIYEVNLDSYTRTHGVYKHQVPSEDCDPDSWEH